MRFGFVIAGIVVVSACGGFQGESSTNATQPAVGSTTLRATTSMSTEPSEPVPTSSSSPEPGSTTETSGADGVPAEILVAIRLDAETRTGIAATDWEVIRGESVVWPNGALGCPEAGAFYLQALVDGFWVELAAQDQRLDYRVGEAGRFRLCENPDNALSPPTTALDD